MNNIIKHGNIAEEYAAMSVTKLKESLELMKHELSDLEKRKTSAQTIKNGLKDYSPTALTFSDKCLEAALASLNCDIDIYNSYIKFNKNLIRVIDALIAFKEGRD